MGMGLLYALLTTLFGSSKDLISKRLSFSVDGAVSAVASFLYALPFYALLLVGMAFMGFEPFHWQSGFLGLVLLRASTDAVAEWSKMESLKRGDISLVAPFLSSSPLFLVVASPLITGDPVRWFGVSGVIFVVMATLILLPKGRGASDLRDWKAIGFGFLSAFAFTLNSCFDRLTVQHASPVLSGFAMTLVAALILIPFTLRTSARRVQLFSAPGGFYIRGAFEVAFMVAKLAALQYIQAPHLAAIMRISLLFSIIGGKVMFKEGDFGRRMAAGALIIVGVFIVLGGEYLGW